jgi:integrase
LFSPERLEKLVLSDIQNPFAKIKLDPAQDVRYRGGVDAEELVRAAVAELEPEQLKAFLLSIGAGLRRNEVDKLEWSAFDFDAGTVHIGPTKYLHPKSEKSIGTVDLDPEILAFFRGWYARRSSTFVLESDIAPRLWTRHPHYRCERIFKELSAWLRTHGLRSRCPIHELRKLFGSRVHEAYGLVAASQSLRHASIGITASHYLSKRPRTTARLGHLLGEGTNVVPIVRNLNAGRRQQEAKWTSRS